MQSLHPALDPTTHLPGEVKNLTRRLSIRSEQPGQRTLLLVIQLFKSVIFKSDRTGKTLSTFVWFPPQRARPWQPHFCVSHEFFYEQIVYHHLRPPFRTFGRPGVQPRTNPQEESGPDGENLGESNGFLSPGMKIKASICSKKLCISCGQGDLLPLPGRYNPLCTSCFSAAKNKSVCTEKHSHTSPQYTPSRVPERKRRKSFGSRVQNTDHFLLWIQPAPCGRS